MRVAVCVKHVPDGQPRLEPDGSRLVRDVPGDINPGDMNALEEALRITESLGGEVIAISMGPEQASESLRTALAVGADRAVLVTDPEAAGSDLIATSRVLAAALGREEPEVVLFGQQTSDGVGGVLWQAVAERLRMPFVSQVTALSVSGTNLTASRQTEFGDDAVEITLPAIVSVSDAINEPRYASLKGKMAAKKKPLDVLGLGDLGLDPGRVGEPGSCTTVRSLADPPSRADSRKVEDEGDAAEVIVEYLVDRQLV